MFTTITKSSFHDAFQRVRPDQFTYEGLGVLFDMLEDYEDATGESIELDVIALCCDFTESSWQEIAEDYSIVAESADDVEKYLQDNSGMFAPVGADAFIYQQF